MEGRNVVDPPSKPNKPVPDRLLLAADVLEEEATGWHGSDLPFAELPTWQSIFA